ncbi:DUF4846 domain-containing protein [candidate division KSB1 bacterium]|nr:DUF4846 domain-containing protein [candidate division KSB1 bacterium]MBL7092768.1 DUF4846 domain-containing protein [candidate division KSB1 bacterium]
MKVNLTKIIFFLLLCATVKSQAQNSTYPWLKNKDRNTSSLCELISPPPGYNRTEAEKHSYASWLRNLPIKSENNNVYLFDGNLKANQTAQFKVLAIDVGRRDLQQCADAAIRLRAEYLFSQKAYDKIAFNFTSGDRASYSEWIEGFRPRVNGNNVEWIRSSQTDSSYENFRAYLDIVFIYAGSYSLSKELNNVEDVSQVKIGDVFIKGGFPGHAIIVLDVVVNKNSQKAIVLAQSYMPAQEIHVLKNPRNSETSPWYIIQETDLLYTPEWTFRWSDLKRFR